jgi:transcriptional regulator with XRE-family HTH domain
MDEPSYTALLGRSIRIRRELTGLSLSDMSKHMGVSSSGWSRVETGTVTMTVTQLRKAAFALGLSPAQLVAAADALESERAAKGRKGDGYQSPQTRAAGPAERKEQRPKCVRCGDDGSPCCMCGAGGLKKVPCDAVTGDEL